MEETWRWSGPRDPIPLPHVQQADALGVVTALHDLAPGVVWTPDAIAARKSLVEAAGLAWSVIESIPVHDAIKRGGTSARPFIDAWKDSLAAAGRAGIPTVCYFAGLTHTDMAARLPDVLREVAPVAEGVGVRLGIHPDDPPRLPFGIPRVVSTAADARALLAAVDSPANGLTLCVGSYGARKGNDVAAMAREFASRVSFAHLRNVRLEQGGSFHESDHLDGETDMVAAIKALPAEERASGRVISLRPNHGPLLATDAGHPMSPGHSFIGRLEGLAELRGVIRALDRRAT